MKIQIKLKFQDLALMTRTNSCLKSHTTHIKDIFRRLKLSKNPWRILVFFLQRNLSVPRYYKKMYQNLANVL